MSHPKRPRDPNQLAKSIIDIATGQQPSPVDDKDPVRCRLARPWPQTKDPGTYRFITRKSGMIAAWFVVIE
jgi:hypothetical protein